MKYPEDTEKLMLVPGDIALEDLIDRVQAKWPGILLSEVVITPGRHNVSGHYQYAHDSDYQLFTEIEASEEWIWLQKEKAKKISDMTEEERIRRDENRGIPHLEAENVEKL